MGISKDFEEVYGVSGAKQLQPTSAQLYGGASPEVPGAGDLSLLHELEITDTPEYHTDAANNGVIWERRQDVSAVPVSANGATKFYTQGVEKIICAAMGYEDLSGPKMFDTTKQAHLFEIPDMGKDQRAYTAAESALATANVNLSPIYNAGDRVNAYLNVAKTTGPSDVICNNLAVKEFSVIGASKEPLMIEFSGPAESVTRDGTKAASATWTSDALDFTNWFELRHGSCKFGVLGDLVARSIFSFSAKVNIGMAEDNFPTGTSNDGKSRAEPVSSGVTEFTLELEINKHDTDAFKDGEQNQTVFGCSIDFVRGGRRLTLLMPHLQIVSSVEDRADGSRVNVTCKGFKPTGTDPFTTERSVSGVEQTLLYSSPFYMVLVNEDDTNYMRAL